MFLHTQILLASIQCRRKTSHRRCANQGEASGKRDNVIFMGQRDIQQRFDRAADTFDAVDFVHETTRSGLIERLAPMQYAVAGPVVRAIPDVVNAPPGILVPPSFAAWSPRM